MILVEKAVELAQQAVLEHTGWHEFPSDAVLKHIYYSKRKRWIFEWKKQGSEVDRILVWISDAGQVLKRIIQYEIEEVAPRVLKVSLSRTKEIIKERVKQKHDLDVEIIDYRKILKEAYIFFVPNPEDRYWVARSNNRIFLIDDAGGLCGMMVMPYMSVSGHCFGPGYYYDSYCNNQQCAAWDTTTYKKYFSKWDAENLYATVIPEEVNDCKNGTLICSGGASIDKYKEALKNPNTKFYVCIAHGAYIGFHFLPYTGETFIGCKTISDALKDREPLSLAFLIHCEAMDRIGKNTLEYYFRKGTSHNTAVIGLKDTTNDSWRAYFYWYPMLLNDIDKNRDKKIKDAYDDACDANPDIIGHVDFTGDETLTLNQIISHETALSIDIQDGDSNSITEASVGDTIYIVGRLTDTVTGNAIQNAEIILYKNGVNANLKDITDTYGKYSIPYVLRETDYPSIVFKTKFEGL